jgi:hypothetical protein
MSVYISSNANRFYCSTENSYGQVSTITALNRIPAVKLSAKQQLQVTSRKDKTGSRTFAGLPPGGRRKTTFDLTTYMTTWDTTTAPPTYGPLFQAALGGTPVLFAGGTAGSNSTASTLQFSVQHGLVTGQAVTYLGELRFVETVINTLSVMVNAPFSTTPSTGAAFGPTVTYFPTTDLPSVSLFDYWSPGAAVQRILCGGGVDKMTVNINGAFHQFEFSGIAQDLADTTSCSSGIGQLTTFPAEPELSSFDYSIVPGNLGQVWLGSTPSQFSTLTSAQVVVGNSLDTREQEFGSSLPLALAPGTRNVSIDFELYQLDDTATPTLYQAAKQQPPISAMSQLGQQPSQLFGVYMQSVLPEVPEYDDSTPRLQWHFGSSRAQGTVDDEVVIAFG